MVIIRLARAGSRKKAFYHVVAADRHRAPNGRFIECVGYYNPNARGKDVRVQIEQERVDFWLTQGAQVSERVTHLLKELKKSPDEAQKAAPSRSEQKKTQIEQSIKTQKKAETFIKKSTPDQDLRNKAEAAQPEKTVSAKIPKEEVKAKGGLKEESKKKEKTESKEDNTPKADANEEAK